MKRSYIGIGIFGTLTAYSVLTLLMGGNPGGALIIGVVGLVVSIGDYITHT